MPPFERASDLDGVPSHNPVHVVGELIEPGGVNVEISRSHAPAARNIESRNVLKGLFRKLGGQLMQGGTPADGRYLQVRVYVAEAELIHHVRPHVVGPITQPLLDVGQTGLRSAGD